MTIGGTGFFEILVMVHVGLLALLMMYYALRPRGRRLGVGQQCIYRCVPCGRVYVDGRSVPLSRCPACGTMNEPVSY